MFRDMAVAACGAMERERKREGGARVGVEGGRDNGSCKSGHDSSSASKITENNNNDCASTTHSSSPSPIHQLLRNAGRMGVSRAYLQDTANAL